MFKVPMLVDEGARRRWGVHLARCRFRCPRWRMYTAEHLVDGDAVHLETEERGF